jgi:hypothetical protein
VRIVVAGSFADVSGQGGATWAVLQYALGFAQLGHKVLLVEPSPGDPSVATYFRRVVDGSGLARRSALLHAGRRTTGVPYAEVAAWAARADVLINLAGTLRDDELTEAVPLRVYVDLDPGFTQLWHSVMGIDMNLGGHDRHVTVGQALGTATCDVPTCGVNWIPTVPPVVLDHWPAVTRAPQYGLTTVANWRSYGPIVHAGTHYGQKAHAVRRLLELPLLVADVVVEPAVSIDPAEAADLDALAAHGWRLQPADAVTGDPDRYRAFVQASTAELAVAKSGYVASRSAWFSDRSACYLASGRPVIAEDTGWPAFLPEGDGLRAFCSVEEAASAVQDVLGDPARHRTAARALAREHFDARRVLSRLLDAVGAA